MSRNPRYHELVEAGWRRKLTPAEELELRALIAVDSQVQADWEAEAALSSGLRRLPDANVPSNFTARVLQAAEMAESREKRAERPVMERWAPWRRFLRTAAFASVVLGAGLLSYHKITEDRREQLAESIATISGVASLPSPEILQDFDAIQAIPPTPPADEQLLVLMQ